MGMKLIRFCAAMLAVSLMLGGCQFAVVESDSVKIGSLSAALAEETETTPEPTLKPIQFRQHDKGNDTRVRRMQEQLVALDYYNDKVDGRFGWFTMLALQDFQRENGLKDTGILDAETEAILYAENARPKNIALKSQDDEDDTRVSQLQKRLNALDYLEIEADGVFGKSTATALKQFQADNGLSESGVLDAETEALIYSESAQAKLLGLGSVDNGDDTRIRTLQERLIELEFLNAEADGAFGESTENALKVFQKENGLSETGVVDAETVALIYSESAQAKLLGLGSRDDETDTRVMRLQKRLIELEFLSAEADGAFGESTEIALKVFQKENGLSETGVMDINTEALIYSENARAKLLGLGSLDDETDTRVMQLQKRLIRLSYLEMEADGAFGQSTDEALKNFQKTNGLSETGLMDDATATLVYSENAIAKPLGLGNRDDENDHRIQALQERLFDLNYLDAEADGVFGQSTEDALKEFQKANGIAESGILDAETEAWISSELALHKFLGRNSRDKGDKTGVQDLQNRLIDLDYLDDSADGAFGKSTEDALIYFQQVNGLSETGVLDVETEAMLYSEMAIPEPTPTPGPLKKGSKGYQVETVQEKLRLYGFNYYDVDGSYGDETREMVSEFQAYAIANYGASYAAPTPEPTPAPMMISSDGETPVPVATPTPDPEPAPIQEYEAEGNLHVDEYFYIAEDRFPVYSRDVAPGEESDEVKRLQNRLMVLEYYYDYADGVYGDKTKEALAYFQSRNGLEETGIADEATQRALYSENAVIAETTEFPYYVKVSLKDQRVYIYRWRDGGYNLLIKEMICSTGLGNSTPKGKFDFGGKRDGRWHYFTEFKCWAQYATRIKGNILFHSVIYSRANENSLRQSSVRNLGHKASHGCVRLMPIDAKWIYYNCPAGTTIEIY